MKAAALIKKEIDVESKVCRWCLSKCDDLDPLPNDDSGQYKLQKLFNCTGFQTDTLPGVSTFLCTKCESRLDKMYTFRWRCNKNIALVNGFTEKQNTVKNEADHLGHSADETVGAELLIKTEATTPDAANDAIQRSCTVPHVNGTHECCGNEPYDLFEAEENPIAKVENGDVDEEDNSPTNPSELICQDREDTSAKTNTCVNDSASETTQNGIAAIDAGKHLKVGRKRKNDQGKTLYRLRSASVSIRNGVAAINAGKRVKVVRKRKNDQAKTLHQLRSYNPRSHQRVDNGRNWNAHDKGHHNKEKHPCPHCSATFIRPSQLKVHTRTHTLEKPFVCEVCDQAFRSSSNLVQHSKIHNKDQHHQCPHCPAKFAQLFNLNDHIHIHTGEKPYVCEICDLAFRFLSNLARHKKIHNKDQYHQCPHCTSKFARLCSLNNHIRTHTGEKPFVCKICNKAFHSSFALAPHSVIHKKNK